jgi:hypothetical protein
MIDRIKAFLKWVYSWITVLTGIVTALPSVLLQFFDMVTGTDIAGIYPMDPQTATRIVAGVAVLKGLCAIIENNRKKAG